MLAPSTQEGEGQTQLVESLLPDVPTALPPMAPTLGGAAAPPSQMASAPPSVEYPAAPAGGYVAPSEEQTALCAPMEHTAAHAAQVDAPPSYDAMLAYRLQMEELNAQESASAAAAAAATAEAHSYSSASSGPAQLRSAGPQTPADVNTITAAEQASALADPDVQADKHKYVRCNSCSQWLQVPDSARMVFCPMCDTTSQCTGENTRYPKKKNKAPKKKPGLFSCFDFTQGQS
uniref:Uncharacterized protein n=2 Tax=Phaeomonas parva TaxID=124430 RepID=A0A6U4FYB0_9STRA|mmetsp:Transcript_27969/g.89107  ORF Transcript_27969/g.89107 Transcript_27969/m.89107 type:complete len:233 (+) Transcript_27969:186-884(+)